MKFQQNLLDFITWYNYISQWKNSPSNLFSS